MKRRKKSSILFSATLATAGVVAGSLIAIANNSQAESFAAMSYEDIVGTLSSDLSISSESVSEALDTKLIIAQVEDESVLENDPFIVNYTKVYKDFYSIEYNTAREAGIGYKTLKREEAVKNVSLNYTFEAARFDLGEWQAWGVSSMKLDTYANSLESSSNVVKVAVLDTGIRPTHIVFSEKASQDRLDTSLGKNYVNYSSPTNNFIDDNGHGTMVSGVIAESTPSNVKIVPIKVLDSEGKCDFNSVIQGASYAMRSGIKLMNMSIGAEQQKVPDSDKTIINNFFTELEGDGAIVVAAAGNEKLGTIDYPAAANGVIAVTSVNQDKSFSSDFSNHGVAADFAAPGSNLWLPSHEVDDGIVVFTNTQTGEQVGADGTSFSSPFVAAAIANILMEHPTWNKTQIMNELKLNAEDLGTPGWDEYYGNGSVSFHVNKYADLTINSVTPSTAWATSSNVAAKATSSSYTINKYALVKGTSTSVPQPSVWKSVGTAGKTINETYNVTENGTYTIWFKNSNNEIKYTTFTVNKIDKDAPLVQSDLTATKVSNTSEKLTVKVIDSLSGLDRIVWYYKASNESSYHDATDSLGGTTSSVTKERTLTNLNPGSYTAYAKVYDQAGNSLTIDSVNFTIEEESDNVTITDLAFPGRWINTNATVTFTVNSENSNITHKALVSGNSTTAPSSWTAVSSPAKTLNEQVTITANGDYTVWYKNASGKTAYKTFTITKIDKTNPTVSSITVSNKTTSGAKLTVSASDNASGIANIEWKYKLESASSYTSKTGTDTSITLSNLSVGNYTAFVIVTDNAGNSTQSQPVNFEIESEPVASDKVTITNVSAPTNWTKENITVTITVSSENSNITHRAVLNGNNAAAPESASAWTQVSNPAKTLTDTITITSNGTYTVWYKNAGGEMKSTVFSINIIDRTNPRITDLKVSNITTSSAKLTASASDSESGIVKYEWKYKLESASEYTSKTGSSSTITLSGLSAGNYIAYVIVTDAAGNSTQSQPVNFEIEEDGPDTPPVVSDNITITSIKVPTAWTNKNVKVTVEVSSEESTITHHALVDGNSTDEPADSAWVEFPNPLKTMTDTITIDKNGTFTVWYKNAGGDTVSETFTVNSIDKAAPVLDGELATSNPTNDGIKLSVNATDAASGIAKVEWYYKLVGASEYEMVTDVYANGQIFSGLADGKSHVFSNLEAGDYVAYAKIYDTAGNFTTTNEITFTIQGPNNEEEPVDGPVDPDTVNPKTGDNIMIISMIGGSILALGAAAAVKLRRR